MCGMYLSIPLGKNLSKVIQNTLEKVATSILNSANVNNVEKKVNNVSPVNFEKDTTRVLRVLNRTREELLQRNKLYEDSQKRCSEFIHKLSDEKFKNLELERKVKELTEHNNNISKTGEESFNKRLTKKKFSSPPTLKIFECFKKEELKRKLNELVDNEDGTLEIKLICKQDVYQVYRYDDEKKPKKKKKKTK